MKKIITLCFFAFAMVLGIHTSNAQSIVEVNAIAAQKTKDIKKAVKFNSETEDLVYQAYQDYAKRQLKIERVESNGGTVSSEAREKSETVLNDKLKSIFSDEQYQRYLTFVNSKKK